VIQNSAPELHHTTLFTGVHNAPLQFFLNHQCTDRKKNPISLGNSSFCCCSRAFQNLISKKHTFVPENEYIP
jgi:hypothetical protein